MSQYHPNDYNNASKVQSETTTTTMTPAHPSTTGCLHKPPSKKKARLLLSYKPWSSSLAKNIDLPRIRAGDIGKCITIVLSLAFFGCMVLHEKGRLNLFSQSYLESGFCISNRDEHWTLQSHALSFAADAIMSIIMMCFVYWGQSRRVGLRREALRPMLKNAWTLLGHGCGHLFLALHTTPQIDDGGGAAMAFERLDPKGKVLAMMALAPVWFGFMSDSKRSYTKTLAFAAFHNALQVYIIPTRFFFTHVLMGVLLNSAFRKLVLPSHEKDLYYDLEACLVDVPILLAAFGEAFFCDDYLIHWGGHVWFDMVVPVKFMVYFVIILCREDTYNNSCDEEKTNKID